MTIYFVKDGDTAYSIARQFGVSPSRLISDNRLDMPDSLVVGQTVVIQYPDTTYTVVAGDTLESVAAANATTPTALLRNNPSLRGSGDIFPGQTLVITYTDPPSAPISVNGYAYPYIEPDVLTETLPYLSSFTVFTYGFTEQGELIAPDDAAILSNAEGAEAKPVMLISTLNEEGAFSNQLGSLLLRSPELQDALLAQITSEMQAKGYTALDIDFEYVSAEDRDNYTNFVARARSALAPLGYPVIVALAPKVRDDQPGLLYEGHDYRALGEAADYVLLMTYEWGYTYGPPMAVAPINKVREVLNYAVGLIAPEKIYMGVPNYGYDWALPYISGETRARSISNVGAVALAREKRADIQFDDVAEAPYFNYTDGGVVHEVWFEDAASIDAKLALVSEYGLRGIGVWNIMRFFPQFTLILNGRYVIRPQ